MMLRAGHIPARGSMCKHTYLTEQLYAAVLESELLLNARLHRLVGWAAMHAHPNADLEGAGNQLKAYFIDALSVVPYLTGGHTGQSALEQDRAAFVRRYEEYKESVLQGRQARPKRDRMANIKQVGKGNAKR